MPDYVTCKLEIIGKRKELLSLCSKLEGPNGGITFENIIGLPIQVKSKEDFSAEVWGTKWEPETVYLSGFWREYFANRFCINDLDMDEIDSIRYFYETPWDPPLKILAEISKQYPSLYIIAEDQGYYDNMYYGWQEYIDGKLIRDMQWPIGALALDRLSEKISTEIKSRKKYIKYSLGLLKKYNVKRYTTMITQLDMEDMFFVKFNQPTRDSKSYDFIELMRALFSNDLKKIESLLEKGVNVNQRDGDSYFPLFIAARRGNHKAMQMLLDAGAEVNMTTAYGITALHRAVGSDHDGRCSTSNYLNCVEKLLKHGADPNFKDINGDTPLGDAICLNKNRRILDLLLSTGGDLTCVKNLKNIITSYNINSDIRELLLKNIDENLDTSIKDYIDIKLKESKEEREYDSSLLEHAIDMEDIFLINECLKNGVDINTNFDTHDISPLFYAIGEKAYTRLRYNIPKYWDEKLFYWVKKEPNPRSIEICRFLIKNGADLNAQYEDKNILQFAAKYSTNPEIIKLLISESGDINRENCYGETAVLLSAKNVNPAIIKVLIDAGANTGKRDNDGNNILYYAKKNPNPEVMKFLCKYLNIQPKEENIVWSMTLGGDRFAGIGMWDLSEPLPKLQEIEELYDNFDPEVRILPKIVTKEKLLTVEGDPLIKFQCKKIELMDEISICHEIISKENTRWYDESLLFISIRAFENCLLINTLHSKVHFEAKISANISKSGNVTFSCNELLDSLGHISDDNLEVEVYEDNKLSIKSIKHSDSFVIQGKTYVDDITNNSTIGNYIKLPEKEFKEMVSHSCVSTSRDDWNEEFYGIYMRISDNRVTMMATDKKRLSYTVLEDLDNPGMKDEVIIPLNFVNIITELITGNGCLLLAIDNGMIFIKIGNRLFKAEFLDGVNFPRFKSVLSMKQRYSKELNSKYFKDTLNRFALSGGSEFIIGIINSKIVFTHEYKDNYLNHGFETEIAVDINYLIEAVGVFKENSDIILKVTDENEPITLTCDSNNRIQHFIMPLERY